MEVSLRWGTASVRKMKKDVQSIRERLQAKILKVENIPAWGSKVEKMKEIDKDLEVAESKLSKLLRMKGVK